MTDPLRSLRLDVNRLQQTVRQLADALATAGAGTTGALRAIDAKDQRAGATLTGLAVGSTDVTITWPRPWPDTQYAVIATIVSGTAALGSLDATLKNGTKTVNDCVITVANTGLAPVGAFALDVIGIRT